ncbi:MAG: GNAT family N-acetyltransferase [Chloroflexota bacterium]|nr:GNAT family N-acetyltransferase [Chloroflexota bacterium]
MSNEPAILNTPRLILRLPKPELAGEVLRYYSENAEHFAPTSPLSPPDADTVEYWQSQLAHSLQQARAGLGLRLFLFSRAAPSDVLGNISVTNIVRDSAQYGDLGYNLAASAQGQGFMTEAAREVIRYAFEDLELHRISAAYLPHNHRSARLLERLGFSIDGLARGLLYIQGRCQDHVRASLLNDRWTQAGSKVAPLPATDSG